MRVPRSVTRGCAVAVTEVNELEGSIRSRRSSLTSSFRAGLSSLRSSLRRHFAGNQPPTLDNTGAICEEAETTPAPSDEKSANSEKTQMEDSHGEEGARRNFTAVSIEEKNDGEKERTRL